MQGMLIYKGKYGATRQYANWLASALDIPLMEAGTEFREQLESASYVVLGTSIYIGKFQLKRWLKRNRRRLANKKIFMFVVAGTSPDEKEKLNAYYRANVPELLRDKCQCFFFPGKLKFSKLSRLDKWLLKMGARFASKTGDKISLEDYNNVKREHIIPLLDAVKDSITPRPAATVKKTPL